MEDKIKVVTAVICLGFFLMVPVLAIMQQGEPELVESMPEGQGKQIVASICSGCHTLGNVLTQQKSSEEWEETVNEMISRGAQIFAEEIDPLVSYLGEHYGAQVGSGPPPSQQERSFSETSVISVMVRRCGVISDKIVAAGKKHFTGWWGGARSGQRRRSTLWPTISLRLVALNSPPLK